MKNASGLLHSTILASLLVCSACFPYANGVQANVANVQAKPTVSPRRIRVDQPLRIVLAKNTVRDSFVMEPAPSMRSTFSGWRSSIHQALRQTFEANFAQVILAEDETPQGLELIVDRADFEKTHTIKFHAVLLQHASEVIDLSGETEGRLVATAPGQYESVVRTLAEEAISKMCEKLYDGIFRSERLEREGFWSKLGQPPAAGR
jgi:hypothetical protein